MATDLELNKARLVIYLKAETSILKNQEYTIGQRTFVKTSLPAVQKTIAHLQQAICAGEGQGTIRIRKVVFRDD